jgi:hypothetical protein
MDPVKKCDDKRTHCFYHVLCLTDDGYWPIAYRFTALFTESTDRHEHDCEIFFLLLLEKRVSP